MLPRLPVPLRGRAGSAAAPAHRAPEASLRPASPGRESRRLAAAEPGAGEAWSRGTGRSQSCRQRVIGAEKGEEPGSGRSPDSLGVAKPCVSPGSSLRLEPRRRSGVGGATAGAGPVSAVGGAAAEGLCRPGVLCAPLPRRLHIASDSPGAGTREPRYLAPPPRPPSQPEPGSSPSRPHPGAVRLAVAAEAASGAHLEPPGRPRWSPRPIWPGRAGSPVRSWSPPWSRGPGALSCAAGAW